MSDYVLSCCSTADLTQEQFDEFDINYVCFHFELDGKEYPDDLGNSMKFKNFYDAMENGAMTKTSQVNVEEYVNYFKGFLDKGLDIIHLTLSSGISGTYNSAMIAKQDLEEEYPDRKIYIIDSLAASGGYGLLMKMLSDKKKEGMSIDDLYNWTEENKLYMNHWVLVTDLTYLIRGGRVSKTSGTVGKMLNICPIIDVNVEGKLINRAKIRTKNKAKLEIVNKMLELAEDGADYSKECYITQAESYEDARSIADMIEEKFPKLKGKVVINYIGTTIGAHTGPGTTAVFFWGKKRVD